MNVSENSSKDEADKKIIDDQIIALFKRNQENLKTCYDGFENIGVLKQYLNEEIN